MQIRVHWTDTGYKILTTTPPTAPAMKRWEELESLTIFLLLRIVITLAFFPSPFLFPLSFSLSLPFLFFWQNSAKCIFYFCFPLFCFQFLFSSVSFKPITWEWICAKPAVLCSMSAEVDFYAVLCVSVDASPEEVKKSYRKLALRWQ